ncbi:phenylacetate--CoA ligase family protein [Mesoflavibacter zeaxanthinifaciens]|uniref:phenylacetate--CoA ligase family protein n=1 Tax=Mesoflavibacter zeaxanthinifaciens TaxID=393060 RepID=UPI003A917EF5
MKDKIYKSFPPFFQNCLISLFNFLAYKKRYGGLYHNYLKGFEKNRNLTFKELQEIQDLRFISLIQHAKKESLFYRELYVGISDISNVKDIIGLPIVSKEQIRKNIDSVYTIPKSKGITSKTGGTTGKSIEVIFTHHNMQERFAMLDNFRSQFGYRLGKRTAWFSGKNLLTPKDLKKNLFWKTDYLYKVRYYSTFHIKRDYLKYYIEDLIKFKPEYFVGFPSTMYEIAKYGIENKINFPKGIVKAIFPTAETVTNPTRNLIESFFKANLYDQYASSEGAPFILECKNKNLHLEMQSGVFEVLDNNDQPAKEGRLVVTSFTTQGTPLIRYNIEDRIKLSDEICDCGNNNPMVKQILGRIDDYIFSKETGKINLGNVSNTLKDVKGIIKFQALQENLESITLKIVIDNDVFSEKDKKQFLMNWRNRVGNLMKLDIEIVDDIPVEKSGKFRMVKNNIKHLIS